jgi:GH15 family glucan-1,4-alpha-glucosidase
MSSAAIEDHGLIGDMQTAALVATDGTVDWMCVPRFDSPSVFASLLDSRDGGSFALAPAASRHVTKQMYLPNTAILLTRHLSAKGSAEVIDFMPVESPGVATERHRLVRVVKGISGSVDFRASIRPRFDYGRAPHKLHRAADGATFEANGISLSLASSFPLVRDGKDITSAFTVRAGEIGAFVIESGRAPRPARITTRLLDRWRKETQDWWRTWLSAATYQGRWREFVERSAITLKLMTYAPTGGIVAAPTTGLPEQIGGQRNWDYRFTWVRDASFSVHALLNLGFTEEARALRLWLRDRIEERAGTPGPPLGVMYRVDGSSDLSEETLDHLEGYRKSRPVRIGNAAADQLQLDVFGDAMNSFYLADKSDDSGTPYRGWQDMAGMLDWLSENWNQADDGLWETRGTRRPFIFGRVMSWVAFDRAIRMANDHGLPADHARWIAERDRLYRTVMEDGWNKSAKAFVQYQGSDVLDAATLLMPAVGIISPADEKWQSTMAAIEKALVSDSLVYRYDPKASPDGLRGSEGTFSLCTGWYIDALTRSGRLQDARFTLEKMQAYGNHLGLFSEEISVTGEQLGNFPQAFTHLSLINAAVNLDQHLDAAHAAARVAALAA